MTPGVGGVRSVIDLSSGRELFDTTHFMAGEWIALNYSSDGASETREYGFGARIAHEDPRSYETLSKLCK